MLIMARTYHPVSILDLGASYDACSHGVCYMILTKPKHFDLCRTSCAWTTLRA